MDFERFKAVKIIMQRAQVNNCPISAVKTTIYKDTATDKHVFVNEFKNNAEYMVASFSVRISCFDEQIKLVGTIKDYKYNDVFAAPGEEFGQNRLIASPDDSINSFAVEITHIEFENDYFWDESIKKIDNHKAEETIAVEMAPEIPVEEAPAIEESTVQSAVSPAEENSVREETAAINENTARVTSVAQENTAAQEKTKEEQKKPKEKKPMPGIIKTVIVFGIIAVLLVVSYIAFCKYNQYSDYNRGAAYMASGEYDYAITVYTRLGNYEDSPALLLEAKKAYAASLYDAGEYEDAISMYQELGNCDELILACYNGWVLSMEKAGQYTEALQLAQNSGLPIDETIINEIKYQLGKQSFENQSYEEAIGFFTEVKDYEDSEKLIQDVSYAYGRQMMDAGNYEKTIELFETIRSYKDVPQLLLQVQYLQGVRYKESKSYESAIKYFTEAGEYEDSAEQIKECYFMQAQDYKKQGQYEKAMEYFKLAGDYEGTEGEYNNALYMYLLEAMKSEVTLETVELLEELPRDYEDSAAIIRTLKRYVDHVGEYEWTTSNDKDINEKGGFEDHIFVKLTFADGEANMTVDGNVVDLKNFKYDSGTNSNTYTMLNTTTITRTFNGKVHTYKKIIEE